MKNITFTTAGIAFLILLQLGTLTYIFLGHHRGHHGRAHNGKEHYQMKAGACPASFKGGDRGHGNSDGPQQGRGKHGHGPMSFEGLNLTPEQQTRIDALKQKHEESEKSIKIKVRELRTKQFQLLREEKLDDAQAESIATQLGQYKKEEALSRMNFFRSVQQVLTKEQKEKLKERMNKHHENKGPEEDQDNK
jgi:Spy/CpxP family protein refolding chaperone